MANVIINDINLTAIADAIRGKNGTSTTYKVSEMATAITNIPTGGSGSGSGGDGSGGGELNFTGVISYLNYNSNWDSILFNPDYQVSFKNIQAMSYAFSGCDVGEIPHTFNGIYLGYSGDADSSFAGSAFENSRITVSPVIKGTTNGNLMKIFCNCPNLKKITIPEDWIIKGETNLNQFARYCSALEEVEGKLNVDPEGAYLTSGQMMFQNCSRLRSIPKDFFSEIDGSLLRNSAAIDNNFYGCYSLRTVPDITQFQRWSYKGYQCTYYMCLTADEITNVGVYIYGSRTSNMFDTTFFSCSRAKDILFERDSNNMPITATWSNQTIDLSSYVGYVNENYVGNITSYTGLTDATRGVFQSSSPTPHSQYNSIKDDPDFWTSDVGYSRYNHASAFRTIQSLPNVTSGSGNTIKFNRLSGNYTAEGGVGDLTESEIGIAIVKGWTVSFV